METRVFKSADKSGTEVTLKFTKPNQTLISKGDFLYREYFSKAIRAGIMTNAEAHKLLKDREIWTEAQEKEVLDARLRISDLEEKIATATKETGIPIFEQLKDLRRTLDSVNSLRSGIVDNTAESVAAEMRTQFFASECVVYNDSGKRVFKDLTEFLQRADEKLALDSYRQALIANFEHILGVKMPLEMDSALPEDKWLSAVSAEASAETTPSEPEKAEDVPLSPKKRGKKKEPVAEE